VLDFGYNVNLEALDSNHLEAIRRWRNDPRIYQWCRQNDLITDVAQRAWYEKISSDPTIKMYMILARNACEGNTHVYVGVCGLTSIDLWNRRAEFSCYIAPTWQNKGYATKALKTLFRHGFENLGLNIIWGESFDGNRAMNIFRKLGMKDEGIRRDFYFKKGRFIDAHLISIKRDELNVEP
jgi:RimJ/RimL family protein N-acetyltransferase